MKTSSKILLSAAFAAAALSACSRESLEPASAQRGNLTEVLFGADAAEIVLQSKASLTTEDEKNFKSAWTEGDVLSVEYSFNGGTPATAPATWNGSAFASSLPEGIGSWSYSAVYPSPDSEGKTDFGSARTQNGNAYNSKYDLMKGSVTADGAAAGKTAGGENIVFPMDRQTAIAYFHLTGSLEEELVSAKLSVEGGSIATSSAKVSSYSDGYGFFSSDDAAPLTEITLTFDEGTAPKASDCRLWFNVIPTQYTKMTLTVETASHSLTISRTPPTGTDEYVAGNLYEVVKEIPSDKWTVKTSAELSYTIEFNSTTKSASAISADTKASSFVVSGADYITEKPFSEVTSSYYGGSADGLPLRVGKQGGAGSITIALSDEGKVNATKIILLAKQYTSGKDYKIKVNGSAEQQPGDDYANLEFALDGSELSSIKLDTDERIYVKSITVVYDEAITYYQKTTSISEGKYLLVYNGKAASEVKSQAFAVSEVTITAAGIRSGKTVDAYAFEISAVSGSETDYTLKLGSAYICYGGSGTALKTSESASDNTYYWTFTFNEDGSVLIKNVSDTTRFIGASSSTDADFSFKAYTTGSNGTSKYPQPTLYKLNE